MFAARGMALVLILVLLALPIAYSWGKVSATIDETTIAEGDSLLLTITAENNQNTPDFSVLEKDFTIFSQQQQREVRVINGQRSDRKIWQLMIAAKDSSQRTIPAIPIGNEKTDTIPIQLTTGQRSNSQQQNVFLKIKAEPGIPYLQQQVVLRIMVYIRDPQNISDLALPTPEIDNAKILSLAPEFHYQTTLNNLKYYVIEKQYALFPQKVGPLTIDNIFLTGNQLHQSSQRRDPYSGSLFQDPFFSSVVKRPFQRRATPLTIEVQTPPVTTEFWLPSTRLQYTAKWEDNDTQFRVGEPKTQIIEIKAEGIPAEFLPDIVTGSVNGIKIYPDKIERKNEIKNKQLVSTLTRRITYVANQAGPFTLPKRSIKWFDINAKQMKTADISAKHFTVTSSLLDETQQTTAPISIKPEPIATPPVAMTNIPLYYKIHVAACYLFMMLWFATVWFWYKSHQNSTKGRVAEKPCESKQQSIKNLKKVFANPQPKIIQQNLVIWGRLFFQDKDIHHPIDFNKHVKDSNLRQLLLNLDSAIYQNNLDSYDPTELLHTLTKLAKTYHDNRDNNQNTYLETQFTTLNPE